jgi:hypothetical protein
MAASRMQILVDFIHVACNWRPCGYNLHATGGHSGTIYMRLAAPRVQFTVYATGRQLHANFSCASGQLRAKPPVFASTLREQLFELQKMKTPLKNLRIYA